MKKIEIITFALYENKRETELKLEDYINEGWKIIGGGGIDQYYRSYVILQKD